MSINSSLLLFVECISFYVYLNITEIRDLGNHTVIDFLIFINELSEWNQPEEARSGQLEEGGNWNNHGTGNNACAPLASRQWGRPGQGEQVLDHKPLEGGDEGNGYPEVIIDLGEDSLKGLRSSFCRP